MPAEEITVSASPEQQPDQRRIVVSLAVECHMPVGEMAALYEHGRAELAVGAQLAKFLDTFATRNVLQSCASAASKSTRPGLPSPYCSPPDGT